jgi:carboxylesterase
MLPEIIATAEPFFFPGKRQKTACLLVHGFTGAPKEMRWLGEYLAEQGYTVMGVRLTGHATRPEDMVRMQWHDWLLSVEDGYHMLRESYPNIFVMGLSMGAILSLTFASQFPVSGVVALSTLYEMLPNPLLPFAGVLKYILPTVAKGPSDWQNPQAAADHVEYPRWPVAGAVQLQKLTTVMHTCLPKVTAPALLVQGRKDGSVPVEHVQKVYDLLGSKDKTILYLDNSGHIVTREPDRPQLFQAVRDFIERICPEGR